jgi:hypothetical protein
MGIPPYRIIYQIVKSRAGWVYLVRKEDRSNAKVVQVLRRGLEPSPNSWYRKQPSAENRVYEKDDIIPLTDKGKYRRMEIIASGHWDDIMEIAVFESL